MPPQDDLEQSQSLTANEHSPLMGQQREAMGAFAKRRHIFFSFTDASERDSSDVPIYDTPFWRFLHYLSFCIGGYTFLVGTLLYYPAMHYAAIGDDATVNLLALWTGWLYTIGSCGFLFVDVQEFFTFTADFWLRVNISCSAIGSTFYIIGSVGFIPSIYATSPLIGILGFIAGSAWIGGSQTWKLYRILSTHEFPYQGSTINAAFVEGGAMVGGYCFLVGTCFFWKGPIEYDVGCEVDCFNYDFVMLLWSIGAFCFSFGGTSLVYRHVVMKLT
jgi:hypothetical protein